MSGKFTDLTNKKINNFTIIKLSKIEEQEYKGKKYKTYYWECQCDCGNKSIKTSARIKTKNCKGCGTSCKISNLKYKLEFGESHFRFIESAYKANAKNKNRIWNLSREEFRKICLQNCHYCGIEPYKIYNEGNNISSNGLIKTNGIDRIFSDIGYELSNCVPCCEICNKAKRDLSLKEWEEWLDRICAFRKNKNGL